MNTPRRVMVKAWVHEAKTYQEQYEAKFHQFGTDFEEFESGAGNFSVAIIEKDNGEVTSVPVHHIRFLDL